VIDDASLAGPYTDGSSRTTKRKRKRKRNEEPTTPVRKIFVTSRDF